MRKLSILVLGLALLAVGCSPSTSGNMTVEGTIKGLKKGTLYLEKYQDTLLVAVDSISIQGDGNFRLVDDVNYPEMYFVNLDHNPNFRLAFFGEPGNIIINSKLDKFSTEAIVNGSKNHELLELHAEMGKRFTDKRLDLIQMNFEASQAGDQAKMDSINRAFDKLIMRKYLYTTNFAIQNSDYDVAPYLALTELANATNQILDTVNNSLSPDIKAGKYGQELQRYLEARSKE